MARKEADEEFIFPCRAEQSRQGRRLQKTGALRLAAPGGYAAPPGEMAAGARRASGSAGKSGPA